MTKRFLIAALALCAGLAFAADSGINVPEVKGSVDKACEDLSARLETLAGDYQVLTSSAAPSGNAWQSYRDRVAGAGQDLAALAQYRRDLAEAVDKLEKASPKPDDLPELLKLKEYAGGSVDALLRRYEAERQRLGLLEEKLEASAQAAAAPFKDPALKAAEEKRRLAAIEKARQLGDKQKEFAAIKGYSRLDPARGGQMMSKFFDGLSPSEKGKMTDMLGPQTASLSLGAGKIGALRSGNGPLLQPRQMGSAVQDIAGPDKQPRPADDKKDSRPPLLTANEAKVSLWNSVAKFSPELAAPHQREAVMGVAADAKTDWLEKKKAGLLAQAAKASDPGEREQYQAAAGRVDKVLAKRAAAFSAEDPEERLQAAGEWNNYVSSLMDGSPEGKAEKALLDRRAALDAGYAALKTDEERAKWLAANKGEYNETAAKLGAIYASGPEYLAARKKEADAQLFLRNNVASFKDGTHFTAGELGLPLPPGQQVKVDRVPPGDVNGARGFSYTDEKGLAHFQSFDDTVRVNEVIDPRDGVKHSVEHRIAPDGTINVVERLPGSKLFRTEERKPDGTLTVEVYGADGKPAASTMRKPDGSMVEALVMEKDGVKRLIYTDPKGAATYEISALADKDGYPRQSGRIVNGVMVADRMELDANTVKVRTGDHVFETRAGGKPAGMEVEMEAIKRLPEAERAGAIKAAAAALAGGDQNKAGPLYQFMSQTARQGGAGARMSVAEVRDDKGNPLYLATILSADGTQKQVLGQWDKLSKEEAAGLPSDVGLSISVRSGAPNEDMSKRNYVKIFRFDGDNVTDRYGSVSRVTGNWFVGYGAEAENFIHRSYTGTNTDFKSIKTGTEELYTSPSIFGHAGNAVGTLGKGAVQLTGSAISVVGAGTVGWADSTLQAEFLERAKSNFYGNDVSRTLGKNLIGDYYEQGYKLAKVDDTRNIQNVGKEMASLGRPTLGAVLQGGVEFSDGVATQLITGGLMPAGSGQAGTMRTLATKGYSAYSNAQGVYDAGASGVEFVQAYRGFNENDPKSKERYYAAVTGLTSSVLSAPQTIGGAMSIKGDLQDMKTAWKGEKVSPILGADGKPYKPPEDLSDFSKFMLGKNDPGVLTRTFTKDLGMDVVLPSGGLAKNPVSSALDAGEKWVDAKVDKWLGKPPAQPAPELILPGQVTPRPEAKVVLTDAPEPRPDVKLVVPGAPEPRPDAKIVLTNAPQPKPDARIILSDDPPPQKDRPKLIIP